MKPIRTQYSPFNNMIEWPSRSWNNNLWILVVSHVSVQAFKVPILWIAKIGRGYITWKISDDKSLQFRFYHKSFPQRLIVKHPPRLANRSRAQNSAVSADWSEGKSRKPRSCEKWIERRRRDQSTWSCRNRMRSDNKSDIALFVYEREYRAPSESNICPSSYSSHDDAILFSTGRAFLWEYTKDGSANSLKCRARVREDDWRSRKSLCLSIDLAKAFRRWIWALTSATTYRSWG